MLPLCSLTHPPRGGDGHKQNWTIHNLAYSYHVQKVFLKLCFETAKYELLIKILDANFWESIESKDLFNMGAVFEIGVFIREGGLDVALVLYVFDQDIGNRDEH